MTHSMANYEDRIDEDGDEVYCSACGSKSATAETHQNGRTWYLCPFCYETNLGISQIYKWPDAELAKQLAQAMNVLLRMLKTPNPEPATPPRRPVAWMNPCIDLADDAFSWDKDPEEGHTVPLYVDPLPARSLTDCQILSMAAHASTMRKDVGGLGALPYRFSEPDIIAFARAVLDETPNPRDGEISQGGG